MVQHTPKSKRTYIFLKFSEKFD